MKEGRKEGRIIRKVKEGRKDNKRMKEGEGRK